MLHSQRIGFLRDTLPAHTALLISDPLDIYYLSNFWSLTPEREAFLFLTSQSATLLLSSFSAAPSVDGLQIYVGSIERHLQEKVLPLFDSLGIKNLSVDGSSLFLKEYELIKRVFPSPTLTTTAITPVLKARMTKDEQEIASIAQANHITHIAIGKAVSQLTTGMTEQDVQFIIENSMREQGAFELAFPTIVAFGGHSALPHHQPSASPLENDQAVLIDCGAKWQHYCADVTRTVWFGDTPDPEFLNIEKIVKDAYQVTLAKLQSHRATVETRSFASLHPATDYNLPATVSAASLDKTARDLITAAGFGPQFIHTTGHGVGLYIHEQPSLNLHNDSMLQPGTIITIEPGIYLEGKFGYRFENSVAITSNGAQELL